MDKIPVGQTIAKAYGFAFGHFFKVLGVVWLPLAVAIGAAWFLFRDVHVPVWTSTEPNAVALSIVSFFSSVWGPLQIWQLVGWVCATVIEVGLTRVALGLGRPVYAYFDLGPPFWRMFGANLIFTAILFIVLFPAILGMALLAGVAVPATQTATAQGWSGNIDWGWVALPLTLLFLAAIIGFYYLYARLWFFIAPVVVAEQHIDIRHSWRLGKGNVLRIIGVIFAIWFPGILVLAAAEAVALFAFLSSIRGDVYLTAQALTEKWPVFAAVLGVVLVAWVFLIAMLHGARAFAYRALVPEAEIPPSM